ncbi:MAG: hypothetical protein ACYTGP_09505 [Planctomycetota bacterium]
METRAHRRLKQLAVAFLREHGCRAVATEVRCPISRYRVDVAGYLDTGDGGVAVDERPPDRDYPRRRPPRTVVVECKQSRADFIRDRRDREVLLERRETLERMRRSIEDKRLKVEEPHLRRNGTSLFPDMDDWDFTGSRLPAYRQVVRRLRRIDAMLHGETKFHMAARYALADRLYIAAPRGMLRMREVPPGWGLLECPSHVLRDDGDPNADLFGDSQLEIIVRAKPQASQERFRQRILRNIAVAASAAAAGALGIR